MSPKPSLKKGQSTQFEESKQSVSFYKNKISNNKSFKQTNKSPSS